MIMKLDTEDEQIQHLNLPPPPPAHKDPLL